MINIGGNIYTNFFCIETTPINKPSSILFLSKDQTQRSAFIRNICQDGDGSKQLHNCMPCKYSQCQQMSIYLTPPLEPQNFKCRETIKSCLKHQKWSLVLLQSNIQIKQQESSNEIASLFVKKEPDGISKVLREMKKMATLFKKDYNYVVILLACSSLKHFEKRHSRLSIEEDRDEQTDTYKKDGFERFASQLIDEDIHERVILYSNSSSDMKKLAQAIQYCASKNEPKSFNVNNFSLNNYFGFENKSEPYTPSFMIIQEELAEYEAEQQLQIKLEAEKQNTKLFIVATLALLVFMAVTLFALSTHYSAEEEEYSHRKIIRALLSRKVAKDGDRGRVIVNPEYKPDQETNRKQHTGNIVEDSTIQSINLTQNQTILLNELKNESSKILNDVILQTFEINQNTTQNIQTIPESQKIWKNTSNLNKDAFQNVIINQNNNQVSNQVDNSKQSKPQNIVLEEEQTKQNVQIASNRKFSQKVDSKKMTTVKTNATNTKSKTINDTNIINKRANMKPTSNPNTKPTVTNTIDVESPKVKVTSQKRPTTINKQKPSSTPTNTKPASKINTSAQNKPTNRIPPPNTNSKINTGGASTTNNVNNNIPNIPKKPQPQSYMKQNKQPIYKKQPTYTKQQVYQKQQQYRQPSSSRVY